MPVFMPIETYPRCKCDGGWGPDALVRVEWEHGVYECVAHLEAGMWLYRDRGDPRAFGELERVPISWCDIGHVYRDVPTGEIADPYPCPGGKVAPATVGGAS